MTALHRLPIFRVRNHAILHADLPHHFALAEDGVEVQLKPLGDEVIEVVLAVAAAFDQAGHFQEREMMADRGLALLQQVAQRADVQFLALQEIVEDLQTGVVGQQFEDRLPRASHVVRLRSTFNPKIFISASSDALKTAMHQEIEMLLGKAALAAAAPMGVA